MASRFKDVPSTNATVVPAVEEKTYDQWRVVRMNLHPKSNAPDNIDYVVMAVVVKGKKKEDGTWDMGEERQHIEVDSLIELMDNDARAAALVTGLLDMVLAVGTAQGKL